MERLDELRQMFKKQGAATDADMDEYIKRGGTYETAGGEKTKAWYNERKKALESAAQPAVTNEAPVPATPVQPSATPAPTAQPTYKMKSIQQAYYDGDIDKNTRDYLLADTIGKFARNMGKDVGNIAAAYSGGTVNNEREASNWDARNAEMMKQGVSAEAATVENSDKQMERAMQKIQQTAGRLKNKQSQYMLMAADKLKEAYNNAPKSSTIKYVLAGLISDVSDGNISEGALMALATAGGAQDIAKKAEEIKAEQDKQRATVDAVNKEFGTKFNSVKDIRKIVLKNHPEMTQSTDEEIIEMYKKDTSALKASTQPSGWWNN